MRECLGGAHALSTPCFLGLTLLLLSPRLLSQQASPTVQRDPQAIAVAERMTNEVGAGVGEVVGGIASGNDKEVTEGLNRIGATVVPLVAGAEAAEAGEAGEAAATATDIQANRATGLDFERQALESEGLSKNTTPMAAVDPKTGQMGQTVPDAIRSSGQTVEVKNVKVLGDSAQLRRQSVVSAQSGQKAQVIVNQGRIQTISPTVQKRMHVKTTRPKQ